MKRILPIFLLALSLLACGRAPTLESQEVIGIVQSKLAEKTFGDCKELLENAIWDAWHDSEARVWTVTVIKGEIVHGEPTLAEIATQALARMRGEPTPTPAPTATPYVSYVKGSWLYYERTGAIVPQQTAC